jgi:hypothetical protein
MSTTPDPTPTPVYQKLPGGGFSWSGRGKLWLGSDHLLEVNTLFAVEWYRRFFFREIKAFTVRRTKTRFIWAMVQGGIGLLFALITAGFIWSGYKSSTADLRPLMYGVAVIFAPLALLCFVLLVLNLALGPSCRCYVLTATGWQPLASPARLGPAVMAQASIVRLVEAAQAAAPTETAPSEPTPAAPETATPAAPETASESAAPYQGAS